MRVQQILRGEGTEEIVNLGLVQSERPAPEASPLLREEITASVEALRERFAGLTAGQMEHLKPARELYRSIGIEPTRYRPSPEALTRRLLRGDEFPWIHPAVDLANLWAIESGLPVGLYDLDKIRGERITVRLGQPGESYEGIRKGEIRAEGRLILADDLGPFGNPSADSLRTSVQPESQRLLFVLFAPPSVGLDRLDRWIAWLRERVDAYLETTSISALV